MTAVKLHLAGGVLLERLLAFVSPILQVDLGDLSKAFLDRDERAHLIAWTWIAVIVVLVFGLVVICRWLLVQYNQPFDCPEKLFEQLCRKHKISRRDQDIVRNVAKAANLASASFVFLEPRIWTEAIADAQKSQATQTELRLRKIARRIVGEIDLSDEHGEP